MLPTYAPTATNAIWPKDMIPVLPEKIWSPTTITTDTKNVVT